MYPDLYRVDTLSDEGAIKEEDENGAEILIPQPNRLQLSFEKVSATGKNFVKMCTDLGSPIGST